MVEIRIVCPESIKYTIGNELHNKLVGCKDYINNNIVLNIDEEGIICLIIDTEKTSTFPIFTLHNRANKYEEDYNVEFLVYPNEDGTKDLSIYKLGFDIEDRIIAMGDDVEREFAAIPAKGDINYDRLIVHFYKNNKADFDINFIGMDITVINKFTFTSI